MSIVLTTDFKGIFSISQNTFKQINVQDFLTQVEDEVLNALMGDKVYNDYLNQIVAGSSTEQKFIDLIAGDGFTTDKVIEEKKTIGECTHVKFTFCVSESGCTDERFVLYRGAKTFLLPFSYFEVGRNDNNSNAVSGYVSPANENSETNTRDDVNGIVITRYNKGVDQYKRGQLFLLEFEEIEAETTAITDLTGNVYRFDVASTKYLKDGDEIEFEGDRLVVSNLIADTSFEVPITSGQTFDAVSDFKYFPFEDLVTQNKKLIPMF